MDAPAAQHPEPGASAAERVRAAAASAATVIAFPPMASFVKPRAESANVVSLAEWRRTRRVAR